MCRDDKYFDSGELIDEVLKSEPRFSLPDNFADRMAEVVSNRFALEQYIREFLIYLAALAGIGLVTVATAYLFFDTDWKAFLELVISNGFMLAGMIFVGLFILFTDRVLLRYFMFKSKLDIG